MEKSISKRIKWQGFFEKKNKNFVGGEQTFFFQSHLYRFTNFDFEELAKTSFDA